MSNSKRTISVQKKAFIKVVKGFTLIELMVGVSMIGIISAIALPNLGEFLIKMRVDNEISELQRLILTTRNTAVNMGLTTTMCPLNQSNACRVNWAGPVTVFIDLNNNEQLDAGETVVKVKAAIQQNDDLQYTNDEAVTFQATGLLSTTNGDFIYCPEDETDFNRGITISASGRASVSSDLDDDDIDEFIGNPPVTILCAVPVAP
ncbi:MAG: GspH/FimT family pseudopilin [Colwellia sp.]|nr:GspH/FimT family pseudopilin [Colwellia sp.]